MIWLSLRGLTAAEIAVPFEYDPHTVRRWINPLQGQGRVGIGGPSALGCTSPGERRARRTHPDAAEAAGGLDGQAATPSPGLPGDVAGDPGPASPRAGQLAPAAAGGEGATPRRPLSWRALHQEIATLPEGAVILAEDESHVNLLPWLRSTWIVKGDRQEVMTPGTNEKRSIFGGNCDAARLASTRSLVPVGRAIEALRHRLSLLQTLLRRQTGRSPLVPDRRVPILPHGCSRRSDRDAPRPRRRPGPGGARCGPR
jgi:hypothetical protein